LKGRYSDFEIVIKDRIRFKIKGRDVKIRERKAMIKSSYSRAKREIQYFDDFSGELWDKIDDILQSEFSKWQGRDIILTLEVKTVITTDKKYYIFVNSSSSPSEISSLSYKRERKTRTVNLRDQNQAKAQFYTPH